MSDAPTFGSKGEVLGRLAAGRAVLTLGIRNARTPDIVRMAKGAGFGAVWVDLEHSSMPIDCAGQIAAAAVDLGLEAWVRTCERDYGVIGRVLDGGATGIIAPRIESADEARRVVAACRFPPRGRRSQLGALPQFNFERFPAPALNRRADEITSVHALLESEAGIAHADEIAATEGIDMLHVGLNDLSADLGHLGNSAHPDLLAACRHVIAAAKRHGKLAAVGGLAAPAQFNDMLAAGAAPLIFAAIDSDLLATSLAARAQDWQTRLANR